VHSHAEPQHESWGRISLFLCPGFRATLSSAVTYIRVAFGIHPSGDARRSMSTHSPLYRCFSYPRTSKPPDSISSRNLSTVRDLAHPRNGDTSQRCASQTRCPTSSAQEGGWGQEYCQRRHASTTQSSCARSKESGVGSRRSSSKWRDIGVRHHGTPNSEPGRGDGGEHHICREVSRKMIDRGQYNPRGKPVSPPGSRESLV
jgi:hypothetical protein